MPKINLVLYKPDTPRFDILYSHREVMLSLYWGFEKLGYDCKISTNSVDGGCVNIVFGWYPGIAHGILEQLPKGSILYNFEQYSHHPMAGTPLEWAAQKFQIWDYCLANIKQWSKINCVRQPYYAPVSFSENLVLDKGDQLDDLGALYIGALTERRSALLYKISTTYNPVMVLTNYWGAQRDEFIRRSKVLLNLSDQNPSLNIFEIVRVSYYLANKKAVISAFRSDYEIEEDIRSVLKIVDENSLAEELSSLMRDDRYRTDYANECFEVFKKRDVRNVIKSYFS